MSYILDALRKADAERERGAVPGLHAQSLPPLSADPDAEPPRRRGRWAAGAAGLLLVAALAGWWLNRPAAPPASDGAPRALPPPPAVAAAPEPAAALPMPAAAPPLPRPAAPLTARRPADAGDSAAAPRAAAASAAPATAPIPPLRDLPDELKRQVPALGIGGSMYSKDPASRMLIVNGQVLHEGDEVAPGLVLEQIRLKSAVLRLKQQRFEISW